MRVVYKPSFIRGNKQKKKKKKKKKKNLFVIYDKILFLIIKILMMNQLYI